MLSQRALDVFVTADIGNDDEGPFQRRQTEGPPPFWTAHWVKTRLTIAVDITEATVSTPGPKAFGNAWPEMVHLLSEINSAEAWKNHKEAFTRAAVRRRMRPTAIEIDMTDEAIVWPGRYLEAGSQQSDALVLWILSVAKDLNVDRELRRRRARADAMIEAIRKNSGQSQAAIEDPVKAAAIARAVTMTANVMLEQAQEAARDARSDKALDKARREAVFARRFAHERFQKEVWDKRLVCRDPKARIRRSEVMPGKVFSQKHYDPMRVDAAQIIADALNEAGVRVR